MKSTQAMTTAMKGATRAMIRMNRKMNLPQMQVRAMHPLWWSGGACSRVFALLLTRLAVVLGHQDIMRKFAMETERMEMTQEMMGDTIDDVMEDEDDEEEEEKVVDQVLSELGIETMDAVPEVPSGVPATGVAAAAPGRVAAPIGAAAGGSGAPPPSGGAGGPPPSAPGGAAGGGPSISDLEARLNNLRK